MTYERKYQYLYNARWNRMSTQFRLGKICVYCNQMGKTTAVSGRQGVTDHIIPHNGNVDLFWRESNWQPLCKVCHDSVKRREEARGYAVGCDEDGLPIDKNHFWNEGEL